MTRRFVRSASIQIPHSRAFDQDRTGHTPMGDPRGPVNKRIRVLFVDNETNLCLIYGKTLNRDNEIEAVTTQDPKQVLEMLNSGRFDVLVTDTIMIGMSGIELARQVNQLHPSVKVIAISGTASLSHYDKGTAHAFLEKPVDPTTLVATIKELVDGKTAQPEGAPAAVPAESAQVAEVPGPAQASPDPLQTSEPEQGALAAQSPPTQQVKPLRILLVDDEPAILRAFTRFFGGNDSVQVTTTPDSTKVLGMLASGEFDLLITDSSMPGLSGPELAQKVRAAYPNIKIIAMSGGTHKPQDYAPGTADGFFKKPFTIDEMEAAIARVTKGEPTQEVIRVLVVDDDYDTAAIIQEVLQDGELVAEKINDPTKVLDMLASGNFDVLVTDTKMPVMMGYELARLVRAAHPSIKIVAMSASHEQDDYDQGTVNDFIPKPFDIRHVLEVVKRVANK